MQLKYLKYNCFWGILHIQKILNLFLNFFLDEQSGTLEEGESEATGFFENYDIDQDDGSVTVDGEDSGGFDDSDDDQEGDGDGICNFEEVEDGGFEDDKGKSGDGDACGNADGDDKDDGDGGEGDDHNDESAEDDKDADDQEQSCIETPLYSSSQISCDEFNSIFLALQRKHNFSSSATESILKLFQMALPPGNKCPSSNYKFEKGLSALYYSYTKNFTCNKCQNILENSSCSNLLCSQFGDNGLGEDSSIFYIIDLFEEIKTFISGM